MKRLAIDSMVVDSVKQSLEKAEQITFSTLGLGEILAGFEKNGDSEGKLKFLSFVESYKKMSVTSFGKQEALIFAELRAKYPSVKPPDAVHLATAISARADAFLTNDRSLECIKEVRIELL